MLDMKDPNDYPILGGSPSLKCSSHKRGGTIGIPSYWGTLQVKSHNLVARHTSRVWFNDDGHETHNNMSLSTSLHRCLAPLAPILFFMMVVKSLHLLHYIEIWLHWCQHFGHGSIGTKFSVRVLWWQWEKSIGVKILAMDQLKIKIK